MYNCVDTRINRYFNNGHACLRILNINRIRDPGHSSSHQFLAGRIVRLTPLPIGYRYEAPGAVQPLTRQNHPSSAQLVQISCLSGSCTSAPLNHDNTAEKKLRIELLRTYDEYCQLLIATSNYVATNQLTHYHPQ